MISNLSRNGKLIFVNAPLKIIFAHYYTIHNLMERFKDLWTVQGADLILKKGTCSSRDNSVYPIHLQEYPVQQKSLGEELMGRMHRTINCILRPVRSKDNQVIFYIRLMNQCLRM